MTRQSWQGGSNTDDDAISVGRAIVEQLAALNKNIGTAIADDAPGSYRFSAGVANVGVYPIALPSNVDLIEIDLNVTPANDNVNFQFRLGAAGSIFSGATDYQYSILRDATSTVVGTAAQVVMSSNMQQSVSAYYYMRFYRPNATGNRKFITWQGGIVDGASGTAPALVSGVGRFLLNTNPVDTIQFLFSAGSITLIEASVRYTAFGP